MISRKCRLLLAALQMSFIAASSHWAAADDWPQWRGPMRDAICKEKGLLKTWPENGPRELWKIEGLGMGYSSVSIAGNTIFTMGDCERNGSKKQHLLAYDLTTRKEKWATPICGPQDDGPRSTPTVDGDRVYALASDGTLVCCAVSDGKILWQKNLEKDFGGRMMSGWRWSESVLVDGNRLLCTPGVEKALMVALDKKTGEAIWTCSAPAFGDKGRDGAGYSSIVISKGAGVKQYVQLAGRGVFGVEAETGKFLWGYNKVANPTANICTPIASGDYVFASTAYDTGTVLLKLVPEGKGVRADEVWWLNFRQFQNHHGGVVLVDGHFYGGTNNNGGPPTCIEMKSGKIVWQKEAPANGSAAYLYADGLFIVRYDSGMVTLMKATPEGQEIVSKFIPQKGNGPAWPHPVVCDGKLYLRHANMLVCYDIKNP